jgi:hypothetical protein
MYPSNSYHQPGDIGGPMNIGEGYRWNVPVLTYAFDQSFLSFFGSNGVAAVESAFQVLNDLPPASQINLANYPLDAKRTHFLAQDLWLMDVRSTMLSILLEQMGLAEATRYIFAPRLWDPILISNRVETTWTNGIIPTNIIERNFDPTTRLPSHYVNEAHYSGEVHIWTNQWDVLEYPMDLNFPPPATVAGYRLGFGEFFTGLTRDDAGGLRYLLATNNVNYESLLPDIHGTETNANSFVDGAQRPGIDKISFVRRDYDSVLGRLVSPWTNVFTDTYIAHRMVRYQRLERVIVQPDFLISAGDTGGRDFVAEPTLRSDTSNWWHGGPRDEDPMSAGPGVIRPPRKIIFHKLDTYVITFEFSSPPVNYSHDQHWGSFDNSTNSPVAFPVKSSPDRDGLVMRFRLFQSPGPDPIRLGTYTWQGPISAGRPLSLEVSTNLTTWEPLITVTNHGGILEWESFEIPRPARFYRVVPQ